MTIEKFIEKYKNSTTAEKINYIIKNKLEINYFKQCNILEFGVDKGISTSLFLEFCKKTGSKLYSIDTINYSSHFIDKNWTFINCRDDDYEKIERYTDFPVDIIFLDTEHTAKHVEQIFYKYFSKLKINGIFIIDDISWLPYLKNNERNNEWIENNNKNTFYKILDILNTNNKNIEVEFLFKHSGLAIIKKLNNNLNKHKKIVSREFSIKNIVRKFIK